MGHHTVSTTQRYYCDKPVSKAVEEMREVWTRTRECRKSDNRGRFRLPSQKTIEFFRGYLDRKVAGLKGFEPLAVRLRVERST